MAVTNCCSKIRFCHQQLQVDYKEIMPMSRNDEFDVHKWIHLYTYMYHIDGYPIYIYIYIYIYICSIQRYISILHAIYLSASECITNWGYCVLKCQMTLYIIYLVAKYRLLVSVIFLSWKPHGLWQRSAWISSPQQTTLAAIRHHHN